MEDSFAVHDFLEKGKPETAIIIGAGYIGLEMADAQVPRLVQVTLDSRTEAVLATVDPVYGRLVEAELQKAWDRGLESREADSIRAAGN